MKMLPSILSLRRPWDVFMMNLSYVAKTEKSHRICEELKDGEQKRWKRELWRKEEIKSVRKVKHLSLTHTCSHACLRKLRHKNRDWDASMCTKQNKTKNALTFGKRKAERSGESTEQRLIFLLHGSWHSFSHRARYSASVFPQLTKTHMLWKWVVQTYFGGKTYSL